MFADITQEILEEFADVQQYGPTNPFPGEGFHMLQTRRSDRSYSPAVARRQRDYDRARDLKRYGNRVRAAMLEGRMPRYRTALVVHIADELGITLPETS